MVCPSLCTPHDCNDASILKVSFPCDNIIEDIPMSGFQVHPSNLVNFLLLKNGIENYEIEFNLKLKKTKTIIIQLIFAMFLLCFS